jgi:hypothetical protein
MMVAAQPSETLVDLYQSTLRNSPEDSHLQSLQRFESLLSKANTTNKISGIIILPAVLYGRET